MSDQEPLLDRRTAGVENLLLFIVLYGFAAAVIIYAMGEPVYAAYFALLSTWISAGIIAREMADYYQSGGEST